MGTYARPATVSAERLLFSMRTNPRPATILASIEAFMVTEVTGENSQKDDVDRSKLVEKEEEEEEKE